MIFNKGKIFDDVSCRNESQSWERTPFFLIVKRIR